MKKKIFVLMYHSVGSKKGYPNVLSDLYKHISIDESDFEKQIKYLKKNGHTFIDFDQLSGDLRKLNKPTIIYFDDGFKDVLLNAKPILDKYKIPSVIFLVTGILNKTDMLWTLLLKKALVDNNYSRIQISQIIEDLKFRSDLERISYMRQYKIEDYPTLYDLFLDIDDVRKMYQDGQSFGSHTVTHPRLSESNIDKFRYEIVESKRYIESLIGSSVNSFSFPYGRVNINLLGEFKKAGYKFLVSKGIGLNKKSDLLEDVVFLKNISPKPNESLVTFKIKLYFLNLFK
jgi:peptidoglycan/xylan/chitin deacetylase (PgdA/CDA1 family)